MAFLQKLGQLRSPVSVYTNLPLTDNVLGDVRLSTDTGDAYVWMISSPTGSLTDWNKVTNSSYNDLLGSPTTSGLAIDNAVAVIKTLAINISYIGFQVLGEFFSAINQMFDGVIDRFSDETGIETKENALYNNFITNAVSFNYYIPNKGDLDTATILLIHGDDIQGSTDFVDLCRTPFINYGAITDTSTKKFGTGSIKFDGVNDYIDLDEYFTESELYRFSTEFGYPGVTLDFWFYSNVSGVQPIISNSPISNLPSLGDPTFGDGEVFLITKNSSNKISALLQCGAWDGDLGQPAEAPLTVESTTVISNGTWYHIAIQKNIEGYLQLFVNGVLEATSTSFNTGYVLNTSLPSTKLYFGRNGSTYLNGYLDEIRWSNTIRYESSFTPMTKAYNTATEPAPTPTIVDASSGNKTVTVYGNARMSGNNLSFGNASLYLDGINSYLSLADSDDWYMDTAGTADSYTKLLLHLDNNITDSETTPKTVTNNNGVTFSNSVSKFGGYSAVFNGTSNQSLSIPDSTDFQFGSGNFTIDFWVNFDSSAFTGDPENYILYYGNGLISSSTFFACEAYLTSSLKQIAFWVASNGTQVLFYGSSYPIVANTWYHIAIVRNGTDWRLYINGTTLGYTTSSYTIPTIPATLGFNLGLPFSTHNARIKIDEFRVSKGIARWTSTFTPPTSAYASPILGDYTVDLWVDPLSLTDLNTYIIGQDDSWKLTLDGASTKYLKYQIVGGASVIATTELPTNTWTHIAIVQSSGTIKIYVNGVLGGSIAGTAMINGTQPLTIGATHTGANMFNGYIEEVRVSKGIARWTSAFTPPLVEYTADSNTQLLLPLNVQTVPNMVLESVGYVANYVPSSARVVIFEEDIDVMEANVDLVIEISRDGGITFTNVTLAKDMEFGDDTLNLFTGSVDLTSQPNGELLVWKLTTQNNKDCRIRGISLTWR
jgi:hypothetical protein